MEENNVNEKKLVLIFEFSDTCEHMKRQQRGIFLVCETLENTRHIISFHLQTTQNVLLSSPLVLPTPHKVACCPGCRLTAALYQHKLY